VSAVLEVREPSARNLEAVQPALVRRFDLLATAQGGVARLRELVVLLALQGKLVEQDLQEESALDWLATIQADRHMRVAKAQGKIPRSLPPVDESQRWFDLPTTWHWVRLNELVAASEAGWSPSCPETPRQGERWGVLKVSAVSWGKFDPDANKELPNELAPRPEHEVRPGDFLLSRANTAELVARSVVVGEAPPREVVLGLPIPVPPFGEQARIVARVDELMGLCDALEAKGRLEAEQHARLLGTLLGTLTDSRTPEELAANWERFADHFHLLLDRPEAVDALEQTILQLAVRGLLVPQDPSDVSADSLMQDIRAEKDRMIADGRIKRDKPLPPIAEGERPFELPSGWAWVTLDSLASQITDGAHHTPSYVPAGVPFLSVKDLSSGVIDFSDTRFISSEAHRDLSKRCNPEFGDLLLTKIGTTGIAVVVDTMAPFSLFVSVALIKLPAISARRDFLALVINSPFVRQQSEDGTEGVGNKNLVLRKIRAFRIPLPPLGEQSRIVPRVKELRRLCADLRQRLTASQTTQCRLAEALVAEMV
jgi:type I restriction enzyme, S subunit